MSIRGRAASRNLSQEDRAVRDANRKRFQTEGREGETTFEFFERIGVEKDGSSVDEAPVATVAADEAEELFTPNPLEENAMYDDEKYGKDDEHDAPMGDDEGPAAGEGTDADEATTGDTQPEDDDGTVGDDDHDMKHFPLDPDAEQVDPGDAEWAGDYPVDDDIHE